MSFEYSPFNGAVDLTGKKDCGGLGLKSFTGK
jgi:hypothetical protein